MSKFRKVFTSGLMFVTVLAMSVVVAPQVDAAASAGDLIKMEGLSSVYYLGSDGKRYVFPNATTYFSWYEDFSGVKTIPQSELESYPLGKNITIRPGTYLVKIQTDPKVYAVEPNGDLVHVPDEATAEALYGENWADRVVDVPDAFFTNYNTTGDEVSSDAFPAGSLVNYGEGNIYYVDADGEARWIEDEAAFEANRFDWDDVLTAPEGMTMPAEGDSITGFETALFDPSAGAGGQAGAGTGLTVAVASDTPAAGNVPQNASAEFLKLNLTASNDGAVTVNSIKLNAYQLGDAENIDNVTFYQDGFKVGTSKNMSSDRTAVFNFADAIEVAAGQTESLTVKATISGTGGNYALGIAQAANVTTNGAVVSGAFPVVGNTKSVVTGVSIGTVELSGMDADTANAEIGEDDVLLAEFTLDTTNEPIIWETARFEQKDDTGVAGNYRIMVDGDEVATAEEEGDYITFDMENFLIDKGDNVDVEVYGDIGVADASDTVNLQIDDVNDFSFVGQDYGFGIEMTYDNTDNAGIVVSLTADDVSVDMDKSEDGTPAQEVRGDTDNVELATMRLKSNGEDAEIEEIAGTDGSADFEIRGSGLECSEIENVELYSVDTGAIYDIAIASGTNSNNCVMTIEEEIYLTNGVEYEFKFRADLKDSIDNGDELRVYVDSSAFTITGVSTDESLNLSPTGVSGAVITVQEASLTWTTQPMTDKSFVMGDSGEIFKATAEAGDSSLVELRAVTLTASTSYVAFDDENFAEIRAYLNGELLGTYSSDISADGQAGAYIKLDGFSSANRVIPAGERYTFVVEADFNQNFNPTGSFNLSVAEDADVEADDVDGDDVATLTVNDGVVSRDVTLAENGSLKVELKTDDTDANDDFYLLAGSENASDKYLGELVLTTQYERVELESLTLAQLGTANNGDIAAVKLYDEDGTLVAGDGVDGSGHVEFDFATGELVLPADEATSLFVAVEAKSINGENDSEGTAEFGETVQYKVNAVDARGYDSGEDIEMAVYTAGDPIDFGEYSPAATTTKTATLTGAKLTSIVSEDLDDTLLTGGTSIIGKYKFVFDNGVNRTDANEAIKAQMKTLALTIATSTGLTVTDVNAYIEGDSSNATDNATIAGNKATINLTTLDGDTELVDGEVVIVVEGTIDGSEDNEYLQTSIASLSGGDFVYNGNNGTSGGDISDPLLNISKVTGDKLTN